MIVRSLCYGYLGATLAGLSIGVAGVFLGMSETSIVTVASPTGIAMGLMGMSLPWARRAMARVRCR